MSPFYFFIFGNIRRIEKQYSYCNMNKTVRLTKRIFFVSILSMIALIGCESKKKVDLPNDTFRKTIIPKITDTANINKFDTLLTNLDKKDISYCQFIQRLSEMEDSCYNIAKRKYPDPENEEDFVKANLQAVNIAESKYFTELNITKDLSRFASSEYGSDQNIRSFCNKHE